MCEDCASYQYQIEQLKRKIRRIRADLKKERRKTNEILQSKDNQHLRKGQKRSKYGRI
jgi:hypothetical protein